MEVTALRITALADDQVALLRIPRSERIGDKVVEIPDTEFYGEEEEVCRKNAYWEARRKGLPHKAAFDFCNSLTASDFLKMVPTLDVEPRWCYVVGVPENRTDIKFGEVALAKLEFSMKYQGLARAFLGTDVNASILCGPENRAIELGSNSDIFLVDARDMYGVLKEKEGDGDMRLQPIWDFVLVKEDERKTKTDGGIEIPDSVKVQTLQGKVEATGDSVVCGYQTLPMPVKNGDRVVFAEHSATKISVDGEPFSIVRASSIYGTLHEN